MRFCYAIIPRIWQAVTITCTFPFSSKVIPKSTFVRAPLGLPREIHISTADQRHICQNLNQFGHGKGTVYGGCSEYTIIPSRYAYLLTTDLDDARAAILERELDYLLPHPIPLPHFLLLKPPISPVFLLPSFLYSLWSGSSSSGRDQPKRRRHPNPRYVHV